MAGLYVHIPFCGSRCIYCDFYSTTGQNALQKSYIDAVLKEFEARKTYLFGEQITTIYIGGGTPSQLEIANLRRLINGILNFAPLKNISEFTVECNPDDLSQPLAEALVDCGVNRISMGVQSFNNERLNFLRRRHKAETIPLVIKRLREVGIKNISIDLIFGFPGETLSEWQRDLLQAIDLDVEHISAYSLMYEENTPLYRLLQSGKIKEIDDELSLQMYDLLIDTLIAAGFEHYEISNFAKPNYRSKHNSSYWNGTKYLGLGAGAHSFNGTTRQWNICDLQAYIRGEGTPQEIEILDERTKFNDLITTALRAKEQITRFKVTC